MDRVGFLIEDTGERLGCLLNPESVEISRTAGVRPRRSAGGLLTGKGLKDDPLLYTSGGTTELKLDLLFDTGLAGSSIQSDDVRDLTRPLWQLAENAVDDEGTGRLRLVRFVWGKSWNIPGIVAAIAERFEDFTGEGVPRRSWLRMRFLRVENPEALSPTPGPLITPPTTVGLEELEAGELAAERVRVHETIGGAASLEDERATGERLDVLAFRAYGDASWWRLLASFNGIDDPTRIPSGRLLQIPSLEPRREA